MPFVQTTQAAIRGKKVERDLAGRGHGVAGNAPAHPHAGR
jgi:hypothetical protein